ncbi:hypothetical protein MASR1M60_17960 [Rhodocyclaceae bacterium]
MNARTYDMSAYTEKVRAALSELKNRQQPGERTGAARKTDVLLAVRPEIKSMLAEGYTAKQIADALRADVFAVLPKTITQLSCRKAARKAPKRTAVEPVAEVLTVKQQTQQQTQQPVRKKQAITQIEDVE